MEPVIRRGRTSSREQTLGAAIEEEIKSDSKSRGKSKARNNTEDEIVRHMSNVPSFLQGAQKRDTIQGKALNFGVLDWNRLEKWKYSEHMPPSHHRSKKTLPPKGASTSTSVPKLGKKLNVDNADTVLLSSGKPISHDLRFRSSGKLVNPGKMDSHEAYSYERNNQGHAARDHKNVEASSSERKETKFSFFSGDNASSQGPSKESGYEVGSISKYFTTDEQSLKDSRDRNRSFSQEMPHFNDIRTSLDGQFSGTSSSAHNEFLMEPPLKSVSGKSRRHSFSMEYSRTRKEASEQSNSKESEPSPSRRFSFSFGRLNRSSSCKESSMFPQLSSGAAGNNKSGPLFSEGSLNACVIEGDKGSVSGRRRSSPLRRLFEPLTKHRRGKSTEIFQTSNVNSETGKHVTSCSEGKSHEGSGIIQALLQVTLKEGLPFFKLVDDNSKDMLAAAAMKKPPTATYGKLDPLLVYMFYSVHEVKKKGFNWMVQGSKSKNCSLGYKILGQMKISNHRKHPYPAEDSSVVITRECILYGADQLQGDDKQSSEFSLGQEIAAVVFEDSILTVGDEITDNGTAVILPGGVHGIPVKGAHSSLISRWRSGGSCDCGGWDIGCKLRVLASDRRKTISRRNHDASSTVGCVNLYVQETTTHSKAKPVFSLEPLKNGLYSVKLDRSMISLLEAFAACVGMVTCREFSEMLDARDVSEADSCRKTTEGNYVSCPPLSPAGRI